MYVTTGDISIDTCVSVVLWIMQLFESRVRALEDRCVHHKTPDINESLAEQNHQTQRSTLSNLYIQLKIEYQILSAKEYK